MGTPKTLQEAIMVGMIQARARAKWDAAKQKRFGALTPAAQRLVEAEMQTEQRQIVEAHVLDFMRQKFGVAYLEIGRWQEDPSYKDPAGIIYELAEATGVVKKAA